MLKLILDTNLFRRRELPGLENYSLSSLFEKINDMITNGIIKDTQLCMNETAFLEYVKQMENDYQKLVIEGYTKAFNIIKDSLPVIKINFRSKDDFFEEYSFGLLNSLLEKNIEFINTIPQKQIGGMVLADVLHKAIHNQAPFDKEHNKNIKDAFISETNNSEAKRNGENTYLYVTNNYKDFENNMVKENFYYIVGIDPNHQETSDRLVSIMKIIMNFGSYVDEDSFCKELSYCKFVRDEITNFLELHIIEGQFYNDIPTIKKCDEEHYEITYELLENSCVEIKFIICEGENEHNCGITYDYSSKEILIKNKYITYLDDNNEEVYFDEF